MPNFVGVVNGSGQTANRNLVLKIKTEAEASGFWTTLRYDTSTAVHELIMVGEGYSGTEEIFVGFRSYEDTPNDCYNISVAGFTGYSSGLTFITQPGYMESGVPAHQSNIETWLTISPQRIAFALKVGTPVYESGYAGKFFPYDRPTLYPYPVIVAGMLSGIPNTRFSNTTHSIPYKGNVANMRMRFVDGQWLQPLTLPWSNTSVADAASARLVSTNGNYPLPPIQLYNTTNGVFGELEGIHYISGFSNAVENTLVVGGKTYVVIQDVYRTGFIDYYAMRLD